MEADKHDFSFWQKAEILQYATPRFTNNFYSKLIYLNGKCREVNKIALRMTQCREEKKFLFFHGNRYHFIGR